MLGRCGDLDSGACCSALGYALQAVQGSVFHAGCQPPALAKVYRWTQETAGFDLDDRLTQGRTLQNREIESLARSFQSASTQELDTGAFDQHLAIVEDFLKWSLDSENRGGRRSLDLAQLAQERNRIQLNLSFAACGAVRTHQTAFSPWKRQRRFGRSATALAHGAMHKAYCVHRGLFSACPAAELADV